MSGKKKGTYLARRERTINNRTGGMTAYEVAYIPAGDENDFPAVLKVSGDVYGQLGSRQAGEPLVFDVLETPPYGDLLAVTVVPG